MTSLAAVRIALPGRLNPTDLTVNAGEMVAVVGPNGGGKTSLLRALARIDAKQGRVTIDGRDLGQSSENERRRLLAYLPASREVRWPITVQDLIALGLAEASSWRIDELVAQFELETLANRPTDRLSTGERARVLMARAFAARPKTLLLDEPLSNLDPYWVLRFTEMFRDAAALGQIVLVALHDLSLLNHFDRAILVANGQIQMNETPADLLASGRFEEIFRVRQTNGSWQITRPADPQSSL